MAAPRRRYLRGAVDEDAAFDVADRVIAQLDGEGIFSRVNFKVIPLKKATATKLQMTLQPIFANRPPRVRASHWSR